MNTRPLFAAYLSLLALSAYAEDTPPQVLLNEDFNTPTGVTGTYPPSTGTEWVRFNQKFTAWSKTGQISVTSAEKVGTNDSGGLTCKVVKAAETGGYTFLNCSFKLPVPSADKIAAVLKSLVVEFAVKLPSADHLSFYMVPSAEWLPEDLKAQSWENRLVIAKEIKGTDKYDKLTYKLADLPPEASAPLVTLLTQGYNKGLTEISVDFVWQLVGTEWVEGQEFSFDDMKVTANPQP